MNCSQSHDLLQQRLDGAPIEDRAALDQHLAQCADCRQLHAAAARLEDGLRLLPPSPPPARLRSAIVAAALDDRRKRTLRRRWIASAALAASLLLAVVAAWATTQRDANGWSIAGGLIVIHHDVAQQPEQYSTQAIVEPDPEPVPAPSVRDSVAEVGSAVAALTLRTANETREQTRLLTDTLPVPMNVFEALPPANEQPSVAVWQETGSRVVSGFEPVTASAKRAFSMFLRETPAAPVQQ